ncbi:MAG: signal peptidase I [Vicinamibacteria bacterium]
MTTVPPKPPSKSVLREYLEMLVGAVVLALFVRAFIFQAFKIPTGSMEPNLLIGDHLLVDKLIFSPSLGFVEDLLFAKRPIQRGDVLVFKFPEDPTRDFIKRVIGLPGETFEIQDKQVLINGKALTEPYAHFLEPPLKRSDPDYGLYGEDLRDNFGPQKIAVGQLMMMGDNRDNSRDSRFWGTLPMSQVKGRAVVVYWSYEATRDEYQREASYQWVKDTASALGRTRWSRFFHVIR